MVFFPFHTLLERACPKKDIHSYISFLHTSQGVSRKKLPYDNLFLDALSTRACQGKNYPTVIFFWTCPRVIFFLDTPQSLSRKRLPLGYHFLDISQVVPKQRLPLGNVFEERVVVSTLPRKGRELGSTPSRTQCVHARVALIQLTCQ